ncbi:MAG: hypothetical protein KBT02_13355 [Treponema sp.]|nr:hypothetical protein [Candidatus Treponema caballi]
MNQPPKKSPKSIKAVLVILCILVIWGAVDLCVSEIIAGKIPHRFASVDEGAELLLANTDYYGAYTQNDIDFRMKKSGATLDELLAVTAGSVKKFSFFEKRYVNHRIARMYRTLRRNKYTLPETDEITFVKMDMSLEGGASGYTHGTEIYLNSVNVTVYTFMSFLPDFNKSMDELLWHELFHCLTRCNHDVEHHNSYAPFVIDGRETDCFVAWITTRDYEEVKSGWSSCEAVALIPIDGTDTYWLSGQASNFNEVFGTNTSYVIDPEECLADNFAYAMLYGIKGKDGQGCPNPEIICF